MRGRRQPTSFGMRTHRVRLAGIRLCKAPFWARKALRSRTGGLAEPGKATVSKTVVGARAPRRFESCILRHTVVVQRTRRRSTRRDSRSCRFDALAGSCCTPTSGQQHDGLHGHFLANCRANTTWACPQSKTVVMPSRRNTQVARRTASSPARTGRVQRFGRADIPFDNASGRVNGSSDVAILLPSCIVCQMTR